MWWALGAVFGVLLAVQAHATSIVALSPASESVGTGEFFSLQIVADLSAPVIGFGLDVQFDSSVIALVSPPAIGPLWTALAAPDGDSLAGASLGGVLGSNVLLATVNFVGVAPGSTAVTVTYTPADPTEGFALLAGGFDNATFQNATVTVPEPSTVSLLAIGAVAAGISSRRRRLAG
jgi:hypothetical protein